MPKRLPHKSETIMPKDILYRHVTELITTTYKDFSIYACGGFVRDLALGIEPKDLDLVVSTNPQLFAEELSKILKSNYFVLDETRNIFRISYSKSDVILNIDISELVVSILSIPCICSINLIFFTKFLNSEGSDDNF